MHRLADDNEDNAPFQIDYLDLGVQAKQLHCTEPPVDWRALSLGFVYCSEMLPSFT